MAIYGTVVLVAHLLPVILLRLPICGFWDGVLLKVLQKTKTRPAFQRVDPTKDSDPKPQKPKYNACPRAYSM